VPGEEGADGACSLADFLAAPRLENATIGVRSCDDDDACVGNVDVALQGVLRHELYDLTRNASYCVFYQLENPLCGKGR